MVNHWKCFWKDYFTFETGGNPVLKKAGLIFQFCGEDINPGIYFEFFWRFWPNEFLPSLDVILLLKQGGENSYLFNLGENVLDFYLGSGGPTKIGFQFYWLAGFGPGLILRRERKPPGWVNAY